MKSETQFFALSDANNSEVLNERPSTLCYSWLRQLGLANGKRNEWRTLFLGRLLLLLSNPSHGFSCDLKQCCPLKTHTRL